MNLYLKIAQYLADWAVHEYGGEQPIVFPRRSPERDILELFIKKRPENTPNDILKDANLLVKLPVFRAGKPEDGFNWLPPDACELLVRKMKARLKMQFWEEVHPIAAQGADITQLIYAWMEKHDIEPTEQAWESLRQMYYRKRKEISKNSHKKFREFGRDTEQTTTTPTNFDNLTQSNTDPE